MPTTVRVHPTWRVAIIAIAVAIVTFSILAGLKNLLPGGRRDDTPSTTSRTRDPSVEPTLAGSSLIPSLALRVPDPQLESAWSAELAQALEGRTEVPVENGRVDVLTEHYAIEVDRLDKWHEAIGQAAHYALKTGKRPVAAIIISTDAWPVSPATQSKLMVVDETCAKQGIKLILLRRSHE